MVFLLLKNVIIRLKGIGYKVFCIISDNNEVNSTGIEYYPHPSDKTRPFFHSFDLVHLLECTENNWLNSKSDQIINYPDFDSGVQ